MGLTLDDESRINRTKGLEFWRNPLNGFAVLKVHYSADPEKDTFEWQERTKKKIGTQGWLREYEINWDTVAGQPVYADFRSDVHIANVGPVPGKPIIRAWDFGQEHPACVWFQVLDEDRIIVFDELMGTNILSVPFADQVLKRYPQWKNTWANTMVYDFCDPAGNQRKDNSQYTTIQLLKKEKGILFRSKASGIINGVNFIRFMFYRRHINKHTGVEEPVIRIHPRCSILIAGFKGKYAMGLEEKVLGVKREMPVKDGYYDHLQDAFRYGIINRFDVYSYGMPEEKSTDATYLYNRSKLFKY